MNFRFNLFAVSVLALYLIANPANSTSSISINNNAYSNIVVAISPDVPNTWSETILQNIQVIYQSIVNISTFNFFKLIYCHCLNVSFYTADDTKSFKRPVPSY
jgi:hypothetical protein